MSEVLNTARRSNRTQDEWDTLARDTIVPMLQAGTTMTEVRSQFGAGNTIRAALTRVGFNTKGQPIELAPVKGSNKKVLASRVLARRQSGVAWWRLELETGLAKQELIELLNSHGHSDVTQGRVVHSERGLARKAKAEAERIAAEAAASKPKRRTRKAKA